MELILSLLAHARVWDVLLVAAWCMLTVRASLHRAVLQSIAVSSVSEVPPCEGKPDGVQDSTSERPAQATPWVIRPFWSCLLEVAPRPRVCGGQGGLHSRGQHAGHVLSRNPRADPIVTKHRSRWAVASV